MNKYIALLTIISCNFCIPCDKQLTKKQKKFEKKYKKTEKQKRDIDKEYEFTTKAIQHQISLQGEVEDTYKQHIKSINNLYINMITQATSPKTEQQTIKEQIQKREVQEKLLKSIIFDKVPAHTPTEIDTKNGKPVKSWW